jgi:short-subunit dehydrogenase
MDFEGAVILITGASEGIGAACAGEFRRRGALLSLVSRSSGKLLKEAGPDDLVTPGDLRDDAVRRFVVERTLQRFGRVDTLINNAGVGLYGPAHETSLDQARELFELNLFAALDLAQLVAPGMKEHGEGAIVNVSSIGGKVMLPWSPVYSASKFALCCLSEALRVELSPYGVHVMAVCPGFVRTGFQQNALSGSAPPLGFWRERWAITPAQCAQAIVRGLERKSKTVVTPWSGWLLVAAQHLFPGLFESRIRAAQATRQKVQRP